MTSTTSNEQRKTNNAPLIRRATPADYLAITALDRLAWDTLEYPEKLADGEHTWRVWTQYALCWVAEDEGEIVGVLLAFANINPITNGTMERAQEREPLGAKRVEVQPVGEAETHIKIRDPAVEPRDDKTPNPRSLEQRERGQQAEPLVGAAVSSIAQGSSPKQGETKKPDLCLHKAFVQAKGRGKGIGSALFDAFLYHCDAHSLSSFLTVAPFNEPAIALYEKMGFTKAEYVEGYYRPDEHRWVMEYRP